MLEPFFSPIGSHILKSNMTSVSVDDFWELLFLSDFLAIEHDSGDG